MESATEQAPPDNNTLEKPGIVRKAALFIVGHSVFLAAAAWLFSVG